MYFWKPGDAKCAEISSAFGLAASENERENIRFAAINLENCEEIGRKYDVDKIPLFIFYRYSREFLKF